MDQQVETYRTIEQPPLPLEAGEELLKTALGDKYTKLLFVNAAELTYLRVNDYGPQGSQGDPRSVLEGTLSNGISFVVDTKLSGNDRKPRALFIQHPQGNGGIYNVETDTYTPGLVNVSNPDAGRKLKEKFVNGLQLGKPSLSREYAPPKAS